MKNFLTIVVALAVLGAMASMYGVWQHFAPVGSAICNVSDQFSCDIVNKSPWSAVFGFPVAGIGVIGYAVLGFLAMRARCGGTQCSTLLSWLLGLTAIGFVFQVYLTYIELWVIGVACPICLISQAAIFGIMVLSVLAWNRVRRDQRSSVQQCVCDTVE